MHTLKKAKKTANQLMKVQGAHGNWDYDAYMHGMYNGMELMMSIIEDRDPVFKKAPKVWGADKAKRVRRRTRR